MLVSSPLEEITNYMADTYKFPNGYDVKVVRKEDIVNSINNNIVDKEVMLALIQRCEMDAINFIRQGKLAGIPFIGGIRASKVRQMLSSPEQQAAINYAKETLSKEQYCLFRKNLAHDNDRRVKAQKHYNMVLSMAVAKNRTGFKKLCKEKGYGYARIHFYLNNTICACENEYIPIDDAESSND